MGKILLIIGLFATFTTAEAATLELHPSRVYDKAGEVVSITVRISSTDQAMNALEGSIRFSPDTLELVSIDKKESIVNFWIQEPSFSNKAGTARFEGVIFTPGFMGEDRQVIVLKFKVKKAGEQKIFLTTGSVLANDGFGTELLKPLKKL